MRLIALAFGGWSVAWLMLMEATVCRLFGHSFLGVDLWSDPDTRPTFEESWTCRRCAWRPASDRDGGDSGC